MRAFNTRSNRVIFSIAAGLAAWMVLVALAINWFQSRYVHEFTQHQPRFLQAQYTEQWFKQLLSFMPAKTTNARVIQLWQPNCLCNRFARIHAINAMNLTKTLGYEHVTLIPSTYQNEKDALQRLNPNTTVIAVDASQLADWPANPSVLIEGPNSALMYIGPLGFGAFCGQANTSVIESQLQGIPQGNSRAFYNQIGQGCFCQWPNKK